MIFGFGKHAAARCQQILTTQVDKNEKEGEEIIAKAHPANKNSIR